MIKFLFIIVCMALCSCSLAPQNTRKNLSTNVIPSLSKVHTPSLFKVYTPYFKIGAAVDARSYITHADLLKQHFNSITLENEMKFEALQPQENQFNFAVADNILAFAHQNNMAVRGHALVWHRQTPDWVFKDIKGKPVSSTLLKKRMCHHITQVMTHFKGQVNAWDVVNEAIMDNGALRTDQEIKEDQRSGWFGIMGEAYIEDAFRCAQLADPDAKLFYNDYYNYIPERHIAIYNLIKKLKAKGVKIDGVGLQGHINIQASTDPQHQSYFQTVENLEKAIELYASLGLEIHITELDMSVYVGGHKYQSTDFYTPITFNAQIQQLQAERYQAFFEMFRRQRGKITSVTFWGIADDNTWLSEFPSGRADFPMLFDRLHRPKPAFYSVINF